MGNIKITFIMEQHLGHKAYYQNLRSVVDECFANQANWVEITYENPGLLINKLSAIPAGVRGSLTGRSQAISGIRQYPADVYFFNTQIPAMLSFPQLNNRPYVISTDITPIQYDQMAELYGHHPDKPGVIKKSKFLINQQLFQNAKHIIPWSTWAAESFIQDYGIDPQKITVIPPGVDLNLWNPGQEKATENRPVRILFVGGDFERKGGLDVLSAFKRLPSGCAELFIVTRSNIPQVPGVTVFRDLKPNSLPLIHLYKTSDIFLFPSRAEAFGIAAVEASAAGLPIISSDIGGLKDIVLDGKTGIKVQPENIDELFTALQTLINNTALRRAMGEEGRRRAVQFFDARKNSYQVLEKITE